MVDIFSRVNPAQHLFRHITHAELVHPVESLTRTDYCPATEPLQVACIGSPAEHSFAPHMHIENRRTIDRTQETWFVLTGWADVDLYDIDGTRLDESVHLGLGDLFITFAGGHGYRKGPGNVLEHKPGPWVGVAADKVML